VKSGLTLSIAGKAVFLFVAPPALRQPVSGAFPDVFIFYG